MFTISPEGGSIDVTIGHTDFVNVGNGFFTSVWSDFWEFITWLAFFFNSLSASTTEYDQIQK